MRCSILTTALMCLATFAAAAQAQIKLPVHQESKAKTQAVSFENASDGNYHHGNLVRIIRNDDPKHAITGILVRTDASKGLLYVRTKPGAAPKTVPVSDIKEIDKGVIRTVGSSGDVGAPEIGRLEIVNGLNRRVTYSAPTLSPGELSQLRALEASENDMTRLDLLARLDERIRENDLAIQAAKGRVAAQFLAQYLAGYYVGADPVLSPAETWSLLPSHAPSVLVEGWPNNPGGGSPGVAIVQPETVPPPVGAPTFAATLAAAHRRFMAAQSHAVYEDGRLIAVIVDNSPVQETPAPR